MNRFDSLVSWKQVAGGMLERCVAVVLVAGIAAAAEPKADQAGAGDALTVSARKIFAPLPKDMATPERPIVAAQAELGRKLFFEPRVSVDGTVSCMRCHQAALYGTDGLPKSHGARDKLQHRNAPTILNSALQFKAHWDGVNDDVEMQAHRAPSGMSFGNPDGAAAVAKLKEISGYEELFRTAFPGSGEAITLEHWATAIGAYERTLVSPSRFDDYLVRATGDILSAAEQRGLAKFISVGCADCHSGVGVGGASFEKFGVVSDYWKATGSAEPDVGRFGVTKNEADRYVFKVPTLRNVAMTPPYFHDGSVAELAAAVRIMAKVQLDEELSEADTNDIVAFLGSLTGTIPATFREAPVLPAGGFRASAPTATK